MSDSINNKIKKNTIYNAVKTLSAVIFPVIVFPYSSRILQPENLGKINFATSIANYISLIASLGIATYAVRECAIVRNNQVKLNKTASQIFSINLLSTFIAYCVLIILIMTNNKLKEEYILIIILCIPVLFQSLGADWINTAMGDLRYVTQRTIVFQVISLVCIFIFVKNPKDYFRFALISSGASIGANMVNMLYHKRYCKIQITKNMNLHRHIKPVLMLFVLTLSQTIFLNIDVTMLGFVKGDIEVGIYSVAVKIYNLASTLFSAISIVIIPQLSYSISQKKYDKVKVLQRYALSYILVLGIPMIFGINILTPEIVILLAGKSYISAVPILRILTVALLFVMFGGAFIGNIVLLPAAREKVFMQASILATFINIVLNYFLIPYYGMVAAAITTVLSELVILVVLIEKGYKEIFTGNIIKMIIQPVIGSILFYPLKIFICRFTNNGFKRTIITIIACAVIYFLTLLLLKNEFLMGFLKNIKTRIKRK